jgi:hypothetical protein
MFAHDAAYFVALPLHISDSNAEPIGMGDCLSNDRFRETRRDIILFLERYLSLQLEIPCDPLLPS